MVACAVGMRRVLHPGPGGAWGPLLVGAFGVGLVIAGVFVVDPGAGFPPGAPAGAPERLSWHGILHEVGSGWSTSPCSSAVWCSCAGSPRAGSGAWVVACVATVVAVLVLVSWPDPDGLSVRLVLAAAILFGFVAALAARPLRGLPNAAGPSAAAGRAGRRADPHAQPAPSGWVAW